MRILRVHPFLRSESFYPFAGGMARTSLRLTEELLRRGHRLAVFPFPDTIGTPTRWGIGGAGDVAVRATVTWPGWVRILRWLWMAGRLAPASHGLQGHLMDAMVLSAYGVTLRDFRPHIVHNHLARRGMPRLHEAIGGKTPLVLTHHHFEPGESLGSYDRVVFVSHTQRARVLQKAGLAQGKTRIVHNPVADEFRSVQILPEEQRQGIVYSGALIPRKGVGVLLEAAAMHPGLRRQPLLLCGEGQLDAERAHFVEQHQLDVRLMGRLPRHELSEVLAGAKLMVLPSRMEGWSASINESLCCGTPVVGYAPQVTELREVLDMDVGLPFEANTQSAADLGRLMVEALDNSLQRTAQRTSLATAARAYLSGERFVREYERVYAEMVD